jgi:hypothetical protein
MREKLTFSSATRKGQNIGVVCDSICPKKDYELTTSSQLFLATITM